MSELKVGQWGIYRDSSDSKPALIRYCKTERNGNYWIEYKFKRGDRLESGSIRNHQATWFDNDPGNWDAAWDLFMGDVNR